MNVAVSAPAGPAIRIARSDDSVSGAIFEDGVINDALIGDSAGSLTPVVGLG